jgi:hypothetical protein
VQLGTGSDDDTDTADDDVADDDSTPADDPEAQFSFTNPTWTDAGRDGAWEAGEDLLITVTMTNRWDTDHMQYPGAHLEADNASVTISAPDFTFFGIPALQSNQADWSVGAPEPAVADVTFTISATSLACGDPGQEQWCPAPNPISFTVPFGG